MQRPLRRPETKTFSSEVPMRRNLGLDMKHLGAVDTLLKLSDDQVLESEGDTLDVEGSSGYSRSPQTHVGSLQGPHAHVPVDGCIVSPYVEAGRTVTVTSVASHLSSRLQPTVQKMPGVALMGAC